MWLAGWPKYHGRALNAPNRGYKPDAVEPLAIVVMPVLYIAKVIIRDAGVPAIVSGWVAQLLSL